MSSVAVVGPGAIGTVVAAALHEAGRTPLLCGRTARASLQLVSDDGTVVVPGPVHVEPAAVDAPVDVLFLAVKVTQTAAAAPWLNALCGDDTVICALQNGVEQLPAVRAVLARGQVVPSVVWFPAQALDDGTVRLRGATRLTLPDLPSSHTVRSALGATRIEVDLAGDFVSVAWHKLLRNAVAGLMVLTGRRAGMFARADTGGLAIAYLEECLRVARAQGAVLGDEVPSEILDHFRGWPPDMSTSILTDREAARPLEWDARNGVIARLGRAHGIPTPISDVLVPLLAAASEGPG